MKPPKIATPIRFSILAGLLAFNLSLPVSAYQQGSFFVIDLRKDAAEEGIAGRKAIASSTFKTEAAEAKARVAGKKPQKTSEFESGIKNFTGGEKSGSSLEGLGILELESEESTGESSFGEDPPAPSGFFFTY